MCRYSDEVRIPDWDGLLSEGLLLRVSQPDLRDTRFCSVCPLHQISQGHDLRGKGVQHLHNWDARPGLVWACVRLFPISLLTLNPLAEGRPAPAAGEAPGLSGPGLGWASSGIITGPNWRPRLPTPWWSENLQAMPHPPPTPWNAVSAASGRGHLAFLELGPPFPRRGGLAFPVRQGRGGGE